MPLNEVTGRAVVDGITVILERRKTTMRGDGRLFYLSRDQKRELKRRAEQIIVARAKADPAHAAKAALNSPRAASRPDWRDSSRNMAGGRRGGGNQLTTWSGGNCLKAAIATMTGRSIESVPDPTSDFAAGDGWLDVYQARLKTACGIRLERREKHACPPRQPGALWIAIIPSYDSESDDNHAVVARGNVVYHDPADDFLRGQPVPMDKLLFGFDLVPANMPKTDRWGRAIT